MIIKERQIEELKPYINNLDELIKKEDDQELLDAIDELIIMNILNNNDEPDDEGIKLQLLYDEIFEQNDD